MADEAPDMRVLTAAAQNLEWLEPHIRGLLSLPAELRKLGGIEKAISESKGRLAAAREVETEFAAERQRRLEEHRISIETMHLDASTEIGRRLRKADEAVAAKHEAADAEIQAKHDNAAEALRAAAEHAETILVEARHAADKIKSDAHTSVAEHTAAIEAQRTTLAGLEAEIAAASERRDAAERRADAAEREATATESRHAKAQSDYAAFLERLPK